MEIYFVQTNAGYGWKTESTELNQADAKAKASFYRNKANGEYATRIRRTRREVVV